MQAEQLFEALRDSAAVRAGFISSLEESELMIDGISHDKISDLTTNILRAHLADYTVAQCNLHSIPIREVAMPPCFNTGSDGVGSLATFISRSTADVAALLVQNPS